MSIYICMYNYECIYIYIYITLTYICQYTNILLDSQPSTNIPISGPMVHWQEGSHMFLTGSFSKNLCTCIIYMYIYTYIYTYIEHYSYMYIVHMYYIYIYTTIVSLPRSSETSSACGAACGAATWGPWASPRRGRSGLELDGDPGTRGIFQEETIKKWKNIGKT